MLTKKQRELLDFVSRFISEHGYSPSYREIMAALNIKSVSTVAQHIDNLVAKDVLRKTNNTVRSIEIVDSSFGLIGLVDQKIRYYEDLGEHDKANILREARSLLSS